MVRECVFIIMKVGNCDAYVWMLSWTSSWLERDSFTLRLLQLLFTQQWWWEAGGRVLGPVHSVASEMTAIPATPEGASNISGSSASEACWLQPWGRRSLSMPTRSALTGAFRCNSNSYSKRSSSGSCLASLQPPTSDGPFRSIALFIACFLSLSTSFALSRTLPRFDWLIPIIGFTHRPCGGSSKKDEESWQAGSKLVGW